MVDNIKLPTTRPSRAARQDFEGLTNHPEDFLPVKLTKQTEKRITKAREEVLISVVVLKGKALLEKLAADYRFAAKRYELERLIREADYYQSLVDVAKTKGGKTIARQAIKQWTIDLYTFIWELSQSSDEQVQELIRRDLYPETEEERSWLQQLGIWMSIGKT